MGPLPAPDRHDGPGLVDEPVPSVAAERHDLILGLEDAVGEPVAAQELPDVLDRIELRGAWRQMQECDVGWDGEPGGGMPSGLIQNDDRFGGVARRFAQASPGMRSRPDANAWPGRCRAAGRAWRGRLRGDGMVVLLQARADAQERLATPRSSSARTFSHSGKSGSTASLSSSRRS